ncbi:MAG: glycosyltransferase family 39 protein [Acidobacteria bacterium]|nr:glycosyltransferase family 39 protein [Acidobacteriota bacterium]
MSARWIGLLVFVVAALRFSWNIQQAGLGARILDPVGQVVAQDEVVYAHTALHMAASGDWLTPKFMERNALYKPPLLYWLMAASTKAFGVSAVALRLPSLLAAAGLVWLVSWWAWQLRGAWGAGVTFALLMSSQLLHNFARVATMDLVLTLAITAALYGAWRSTGRRWVPGVMAGLAIVTKGIAGLLPLIMMRSGWAVGLAGAVAAPWFLAQLAVNTEWFWQEFVLTEVLHWGLASPVQTSGDPAWIFYPLRLLRLDPALAMVGLAGLWFARQERWLLWWVGTLVGAVLVFQYHNIAYWVPLLPALALAAAWIPWEWNTALKATALAVVLVSAAWITQSDFAPQAIPAAAQLRAYCHQPGAELILIDPDDQFYATLLPLPLVRYGFFDAGQAADRAPLDFQARKILVRPEEFTRQPLPVATAILYRNPAEVATLIRTHPDIDFLLPAVLAPADAPHQRTPAANGRVWLRSDSPGLTRHPDPGSCELLP